MENPGSNQDQEKGQDQIQSNNETKVVVNEENKVETNHERQAENNAESDKLENKETSEMQNLHDQSKEATSKAREGQDNDDGGDYGDDNEQQEDGKKSNKPQKDSNQGRWQKDEHQRFIEALGIYGKNWKKVEEFVGTRTGAQIRSHAQKFFNRLERENEKQQKEGLGIDSLKQKKMTKSGPNKRKESADDDDSRLISHEPLTAEQYGYHDNNYRDDSIISLIDRVHQTDKNQNMRQKLEKFATQANQEISEKQHNGEPTNKLERRIAYVNGALNLYDAYDNFRQTNLYDNRLDPYQQTPSFNELGFSPYQQALLQQQQQQQQLQQLQQLQLQQQLKQLQAQQQIPINQDLFFNTILQRYNRIFQQPKDVNLHQLSDLGKVNYPARDFDLNQDSQSEKGGAKKRKSSFLLHQGSDDDLSQNEQKYEDFKKKTKKSPLKNFSEKSFEPKQEENPEGLTINVDLKHKFSFAQDINQTSQPQTPHFTSAKPPL